MQETDSRMRYSKHQFNADWLVTVHIVELCYGGQAVMSHLRWLKNESFMSDN